MRLSISTKIFIGFAVVIVVFGATCAYTLWRMSSLRRSVTLIVQEVVPVSAQLERLSERLKSTEALLAFKRPEGDVERLQQILPSLEAFHGSDGIDAVTQRIQRLARASALAESDRAVLTRVAMQLQAFSSGRALVDAAVGEGLDDLVDRADPLPSHVFYDRLVRRTLKRAGTGTLSASTPETRATVRVLRRILREVDDAIRALDGPVRGLEARVEADEKATILTVVLIASGALVLSLLMLWISQLTLRPLQRLQEGAKRIAAGEYHETVEVRSSDEIGDLANEFNRMAKSLQLRDAQLERQREELLRTERLATIGKLAAQITHEVRNPLSSIGLNAELLEEELGDIPADAESRVSLRAITDEVDRLKAITEAYLAFARLPRPQRGTVDVGALIEQFLGFLQYEVAQAGIEVTTIGVAPSLEGGPPPIRADADQLRQALLNIARNAIEALRTTPAPRRLSVELAPLPEGGVQIRFVDTGPGIDDGVRARIFEPFVTGKSHGTGLGLALTREIVVEHGGTIEAASPVADGRGTAFTIRLPRGRSIGEGAQAPVVGA